MDFNRLMKSPVRKVGIADPPPKVTRQGTARSAPKFCPRIRRTASSFRQEPVAAVSAHSRVFALPLPGMFGRPGQRLDQGAVDAGLQKEAGPSVQHDRLVSGSRTPAPCLDKRGPRWDRAATATGGASDRHCPPEIADVHK